MYRDPVTILEYALYGHVDSPTSWEVHCDTELAAALTYVRNSWGNRAPAVPAAAIAAERATGRTAPWTWAELAGTRPE